MVDVNDYEKIGETSFRKGTPKGVIGELERARTCNLRIRIWLGDTETGRSWLEESDVEGYVGRSMGPRLKVPLLLRSRRSDGGGEILTHCIVKMKIFGRGIVYQHPSFHVPKLEIKPSDMPEYAEMVTADGGVHARFPKHGQAARWVGKMS